jgi:hypothetical protein
MVEEAFDSTADVIPITMGAAAVFDQQNYRGGLFRGLDSKLSWLAVFEEAKTCRWEPADQFVSLLNVQVEGDLC